MTVLKRISCCLFLAVCLAASAEAYPDQPFRVLLFGHSAGFVHATVKTMQEKLHAEGEQTGLFTSVVTNDCAALTADNLKNFDIVVFYTSGNLPIDDSQKQALLDFIKGGGGFLGIHSATDCNYNWAAYGEMLGGYFDLHPWHQKVVLKIEDQDHPATEHLGSTWAVTDEIYQQRNWSRDKVQVLQSIDVSSVDLTKPMVHRTDGDFALAWCKPYGEGRVFYEGLGHRQELWADDSDFRQQLSGALKWLARVDWRSDPDIQKLVKAGDVDGLAVMSQRGLPALRGEPIAALSAVDSGAAPAKLAELASAGEWPLRLAAIRALGRVKSGDVEALLKLSADPLPEVRQAALLALGSRGTDAAAKGLIAVLGDPDEAVQQTAIAALGRCDGDAARDALLGVLNGPAPKLQAAALGALATRDDETIDAALLKLLQTRPADHAEALPDIATRLAPKAKQDVVFEALVAAVEQGTPNLKRAAVRAVAGSDREGLAEVMTPWLFGDDSGVSSIAAAELARLPEVDLSGYLTPFSPTWLVCGPFPNPDGQGFQQVFGPETFLDFTLAYEGEGGQAKWSEAKVDPRGVLNFMDSWPKHKQNVCGYAYSVIHADQPTECQLRLGSDDGCKVWLNGELVVNRPGARGLSLDGDRITVQLKVGDNPLLVKVIQGAGSWELAARVGRADGKLSGVTFDAPQGLFETPYVAQWLVCGPFENVDRAAHQQVLPPETELNFGAKYDGAGGQVGWHAVEAKGGLVDFLKVFERQASAAAYAFTTVTAKAACDAELRVGSDDGCVVWVNGEKVLDKDVDRGLVRDGDKVKVHLNAGPNKLLVKVLQQTGDWSLCARFGSLGGVLPGVKFELPEVK